MKWFLKSIIRIAVINFAFLLLATLILSFQKPKVIAMVNPPVNQPSVTKILEKNIVVQKEDIFASLKIHNLKTDCWIGYRGHIYNITAVFGTHPGGDTVMLKYCGSDATASFDSKEMNPPMPHSANALSLLSQYLVK